MENSDKPTKKPPRQVFNDIQIKKEAIEKIAAGRPTTTIAKDYNVDPSTISKLKKRNKEHIEKLALQLAETVAPKYIQRITTDICTAKKLSKYINNPKKTGIIPSYKTNKTFSPSLEIQTRLVPIL